MNGHEAEGGRRIVVGVDGSRPSIAALRWAVATAGDRPIDVEAVLVWDPLPPRAPYAPVSAELDRAERAAGILSRAVREALGSTDHPGVLLRTLAGEAAQVLPDAADGADLVVVGAHSSSPRDRSAVGATARACIRRCVCPIVVIPAGRTVPDEFNALRTVRSERDTRTQRASPGTPPIWS